MTSDNEAATSSRTLRFDPWLAPNSAPLKALADQVFRQLEALRPVPLGRRPRSDAIDRRRLMVASLVSNLAACVLLVPAPDRLLISTAKVAATRYDHPSLPHKVIAWAVAGFEALGLAYRWPGMRGQATTALEPSDAFRRQMASHRVTNIAEIGRTPGAESVILKAAAVERHGPKRLLNYGDTSETRRMRAELEELSSFINAAGVEAQGQRHIPAHLVRQFQVPSAHAPHTFTMHGRIYGWFGIAMQRQERHRIRIAGEPCADLDFVAMLTNLAYAKVGAPLPSSDAYAGLPGLESPSPSERDAIKQAINALYFSDGLLRRLPEDVKAGLGSAWTAARFVEAVQERHSAIAHLFGSGIGLSLLYTESCIMMRTLLDLMDLGVVALPIHDGCMVKLRDADLAVRTMVEASRAITGVALPVKVKELGERAGLKVPLYGVAPSSVSP